MTADTVHASAVQIAGKGVLILGPSGLGKSALALDLIDQAMLRGVPAQLVGDDRIVLEHKDGRIVARPAPQLAGLVEVRGSGIHRINHVGEAELDLAVRLMTESEAEQMPPEDAVEVAPGFYLPQLKVPQGQPALRAVLARLGLYAGVQNRPI